MINRFAGLKPESKDLVDISRLLSAYETDKPDPSVTEQRVSFGTSGHRGSSFNRSFNRDHILAMTQAICDYRKNAGTDGPLFLGFDTHALSRPAYETTLEVLAANGVTTMTAAHDEFTPTPVISHAILTYNRARKTGLADGIVITPSHNPPDQGGFKYNPVHGGPAEKEITDVIQNRANDLLKNGLNGVKQTSFVQAQAQPCVHTYDFVTPYVRDLENVLDFEVIRNSGLKIGVDPMGGAGVHYWPRIAELYKINLTVLNPETDPQFAFMTRDWDGKIRMDPSSPYAMRGLIEGAARFDIAFGCDTDHDRHGIVTRVSGQASLMPANHFLATSIFYLFKNRPDWKADLKIGKTLVSSQMIDRVGKLIDREVYEVPVGFKWFVDGLKNGTLGFVGEESAGATFLRKNGDVWTTDKDGLIPALLSAEMTASTGKNPSEIYHELTETLGAPVYDRVEAPATAAQRALLGKLKPEQILIHEAGGDKIEKILTTASGNGASIGGLKLETKNGWLAARPSGTEDIYKIYVESFLNKEHLELLIKDGRKIIDDAFKNA